MPGKLKDTLRRRLFGRRLLERLRTDHATLARFGNRHYFRAAPRLLAPGFAPGIEAFEFRHHSQNGEDGVLLELLSRVGVSCRRMVEIGTGDGRECNSANLILNFGWEGFLFEADTADAAAAGDYFRACGAGDRVWVRPGAVTPENSSGLLQEAGVQDDADVLSIDVDGIDYWLWRSIELRPRLVVIEYNASLGPQRSLTVPHPFQPRPLQSYHGASLAALTALAQQKGYILAGCDSRGINAFYVRGDLAAESDLEAVPVAEAFRPHYWRSQTRDQKQQFSEVAHLPWMQVQ